MNEAKIKEAAKAIVEFDERKVIETVFVECGEGMLLVESNDPPESNPSPVWFYVPVLGIHIWCGRYDPVHSGPKKKAAEDAFRSAVQVMKQGVMVAHMATDMTPGQMEQAAIDAQEMILKEYRKLKPAGG